MPFGAHETMEVHEILNEKMNLIEHFALYGQMAQSPAVRDLVSRHLQTAVAGYDQLVAYTHDYSAAKAPGAGMPGFNSGIRPEQIQYGLDRPAPMAPMLQGALNDRQILAAVLSCHKASAKNHMQACLECADPNVRRMLQQGANLCAEQAYETFLIMNQQGLYQVPTMQDHTAKTFLHAYQPTNPGPAPMM
ncbi:coat F domain-containing protein [Paenibacillus mucilaginosus 3016]|uniref:Coat F domain-containing protein n=2 Tax=Paenibacillus mucilaginosus TaxID=61624 RepID=H6NIC0_9BACL|nr:spore coat protein [Paenibacillus mucilaginosus]AFC31523.1 coat F domain-containing protein [Paenibacillus mucilaginosus 3016]AFH63867.1 coat protein F [Paenibacillus mucilaginosus K02]WFA20064.1 spore coat protein [Paenibacillus mucilaginosus]